VVVLPAFSVQASLEAMLLTAALRPTTELRQEELASAAKAATTPVF
jgi:DNA-binding GntR family transcriptional regulator